MKTGIALAAAITTLTAAPFASAGRDTPVYRGKPAGPEGSVSVF